MAFYPSDKKYFMNMFLICIYANKYMTKGSSYDKDSSSTFIKRMNMYKDVYKYIITYALTV